jgi:hypothetical protein
MHVSTLRCQSAHITQRTEILSHISHLMTVKGILEDGWQERKVFKNFWTHFYFILSPSSVMSALTLIQTQT